MPSSKHVAYDPQSGAVARETNSDYVDDEWLAEQAGRTVEVVPLGVAYFKSVSVQREAGFPLDDPLRDLIEAATKRALPL